MIKEVEQRKGAAESRNVDDDNEEKWVYDSSVDYKGRVPIRSKTGVWKASIFIIAIEFSERLSYFGISTSLIIYLTQVINYDLKTAAKNVNYWSGVTTLMPLFGAFLADSYLGCYTTVIVSSITYLLGLALLTMSWFIPNLRACEGDVCMKPRKVHEVVYFLSIYLISVGTGGHKPSLQSFGADQFDDNHSAERKQKMSYFNWWNFGLCCGLLLGVTVITYVQDHVNWGVADIILTAVMAVSIAIFITGRPFYRYRVPTGSPLTPMLQVLVAAIAKRNLPHPSNPAHLYEVPSAENEQGRKLCHTNKLKFLDKAAIMEDNDNSVEMQRSALRLATSTKVEEAAIFEENNNNSVEKQPSPWRLVTVTKVEELKLLLNMIPIWLSTLPFGICVAQASTFFIKQGNTLNLKIGNGFEIPPASIYSLAAIGMIVSVTIYEKILVPFLRRATGNERGIKILQRIGIGMLFSIATMVVAALVERKRLSVVEKEKSSISMSVFWLAPQFLIIGIGDGFALVGLQEYFYDQVPDSMRSLGIAFYLSVIGSANFLSSLLITVVDRVTEKHGGNWFQKDLNNSRLDNFYWLLATITAMNMFLYVFLARKYSYKDVQGTVAVADCYKDDEAAGSMA